MGQPNQILAPTTADGGLYQELWISLGSLLRSYTAAHGLHSGSQATIEIENHRIIARHGKKCLRLNRTGADIEWNRENGESGMLLMTPAGHLQNHEHEEPLDMAAEAWARELMR